MATDVFVVTCEGNIPFMRATDQQLEECERLVFNRRGQLINRVRPEEFGRICEGLERKRMAVLASCAR